MPRKSDRLKSPNWHFPQLALPQTGTSPNWHFLQLGPPPTGTSVHRACRVHPTAVELKLEIKILKKYFEILKSLWESSLKRFQWKPRALKIVKLNWNYTFYNNLFCTNYSSISSKNLLIAISLTDIVYDWLLWVKIRRDIIIFYN